MTDEERCDREIAEILGRADVVGGHAPAWLVTLGVEDWEKERRMIMAEKTKERIMAEALILGAEVLSEAEAELQGGVNVKCWHCSYCGTTTITQEEAYAHDGACLKHPMAERALKAEARFAELEIEARRARDGQAEANRICQEALEELLDRRIAELTADEGPRKAAERIVEQVFFAEPPRATATRLVDAITTAIQAASNAQLERGRKRIAELREELQKVTKHWRGSLDERIALDHRNHVYDFMVKFQQQIGDTPGWPPQEALDLRVKLMAEEFCEMLEAGGYEGNFWIARSSSLPDFGGVPTVEIANWCHEPDEPSEEARNFPAFIRELLDLETTALGTHIACGVDPAEPWTRVVAANMAKELVAGQPVKPEGWQAPDIAGALREQGWQGGAE